MPIAVRTYAYNDDWDLFLKVGPYRTTAQTPNELNIGRPFGALIENIFAFIFTTVSGSKFTRAIMIILTAYSAINIKRTLQNFKVTEVESTVVSSSIFLSAGMAAYIASTHHVVYGVIPILISSLVALSLSNQNFYLDRKKHIYLSLLLALGFLTYQISTFSIFVVCGAVILFADDEDKRVVWGYSKNIFKISVLAVLFYWIAIHSYHRDDLPPPYALKLGFHLSSSLIGELFRRVSVFGVIESIEKLHWPFISTILTGIFFSAVRQIFKYKRVSLLRSFTFILLVIGSVSPLIFGGPVLIWRTIYPLSALFILLFIWSLKQIAITLGNKKPLVIYLIVVGLASTNLFKELNAWSLNQEQVYARLKEVIKSNGPNENLLIRDVNPTVHYPSGIVGDEFYSTPCPGLYICEVMVNQAYRELSLAEPKGILIDSSVKMKKSFKVKTFTQFSLRKIDGAEKLQSDENDQVFSFQFENIVGDIDSFMNRLDHEYGIHLCGKEKSVMIQHPKAINISKYFIKTAPNWDESNFPKNWIISCLNQREEWLTIDRKTDFKSWDVNHSQEFNIGKHLCKNVKVEFQHEAECVSFTNFVFEN